MYREGMLTDKIEIVHDTVEPESDRPIRETWSFWFDDHIDTLIIDTYRKDGRRPNSKRAWDTLAFYNRLGRRDSTIKNASDVPLPPRIVNKAISVLIDRAQQVRVKHEEKKS